MTNSPLVLAVDDEAAILRLIKLELTGQGFRVMTAESGDEALRLVGERRPDIALLDIVMPRMSGLELMRHLREQSQIPVILLTAKGNEADRVRGLELGADDYVAKPFSPEELAARVRAVLRRAPQHVGLEHIVRAGDIEVDLSRRLVKRRGDLVLLTRTEWMLLQHLATNAGKILLTGELLARVWGPEYRDDLQYLRVWVSRLRRKLEDDPASPRLIRTFPGIGYMFDVQADGSAAQEDGAEPSDRGEPASVYAEQAAL